MKGENPRTDGFFEAEWPGGRCASDEIAEAAVRVAQDEPQERKIKHIGFLLGNVGFDSCDFDRVTANHLVRIAHELSYTQMQLIALVGRREEVSLPPRGHLDHEMSWKAASIHVQLEELGWSQRDLLLQTKRERRPGEKLLERLGAPEDQRLGGFGRALFDSMDLDRVPIEELRDVAAALWEVSKESTEETAETTGS